MRRLKLAFAVASAFCAAALTTFAAPAFAAVDYRLNIGYQSGLPMEPDPAPRKIRPTAWIHNKVEDFGGALAAKYLAMEKMAESWARRVGKRYQHATRAPVWA